MGRDSTIAKKMCASLTDQRLRRRMGVAGGEGQKEVDAEVRAVR
jgi:hypothetical protein